MLLDLAVQLKLGAPRALRIGVWLVAAYLEPPTCQAGYLDERLDWDRKGRSAGSSRLGGLDNGCRLRRGGSWLLLTVLGKLMLLQCTI